MKSPRDINRIILFDFDGVVADSLEVFLEVFLGICHEMGFYRLNSREAFLDLFDRNPIRRLFWAGFPLWRLKELGRRFQPRIEAANQQIRPFEKMPNVIRELTQIHPVYIITSNVTAATRQFLKHHQIDGIQDVLGADLEISKVKKIRRVIKQHPGCRAYYVCDTKGDIYEARRAGAATVAVGWGWHPIARLQQANPHHLVQAPEQLLELFIHPGGS